MLARLADGEWHTLDDLLHTALPTIPQQRAIRAAEHRRAYDKARRASETTATTRAGDPVMRGARDIARSTLLQLARYHRLEHANNQYRLTPKGQP